MKLKGFFWQFTILMAIFSCDQPFSYSPFDASIPESLRNTTEKNLKKLKETGDQSDSVIHVALISDSHYHYNDLADAIDHINSDTSVDLVIVTGDITENGLQKEFEIFHDLMSKSVKPYFAVIGNHDYLSNGGALYQQMFGSLNYSFTFSHVKFIMWDNVLWESNKTPDWEWFASELSNSADEGQSTQPSVKIPFSHIPPVDDQLADSASVYHDMLRDHGISVSVHGHKHDYMNEELFSGGVRYVTIGSPKKRSYARLTVIGKDVVVEQVHF